MKKNREQRIKEFERFLESAEEKFYSFKDNDKRAKTFESIYSFHVFPGGRIGGLDKRIFEVFFGKRAYDSIHKGSIQKNLVEEGSTLIIQITDIGKVYISIFPAKTEFRSLEESSITLYRSIEPYKLLSDHFLKKIWTDFMAFTEFSSLEGEPTFFDKLRVRYLRYTKNVVIGTKEQETKLSKMLVRLFELVITIGFSGFLIFIISLFLNSKQNTEMNGKLDNLNNSVIELNKAVDEIKNQQITNENIKTYLIHIDSLIQSTSNIRIDKSLENKNK